MRTSSWKIIVLLPLALAACGDLPTNSSAPDVAGAGPLQTGGCTWLADGSVSCPPIQPIWDDCDPYHFDCGEDDCITSTGGAESATIQSCGGGGGGTGAGSGDDESGGGSGGGTGTPGSPLCPDYGCTPPCDPAIHPNCEKPLTTSDTATINLVLREFLRPATAFTDSTARKDCVQMETWFRDALAAGAVFRGAFDSDATNDPYGSHYGMATPGGNIHFDPLALEAANAGSADARREVAITALHEAAHRQGFHHPTYPKFDSLGRDSYSDPPFHRLSPGPNSCVPR